MNEAMEPSGLLKKAAVFIAAILAFVLLDQFTKWYVFEHMLRIAGTPIGFGDWWIHMQSREDSMTSLANFKNVAVTPVFDFVAVWNPGISFGLLQDGSYTMSVLLTGFAFLMAIVVSVWGIRSPRRAEQIATFLIAAGAISNALDRIRFKAVADFLYFNYKGYYWPAFNIADSCITIGAIILVFFVLFMDTDKE